MFWDNVLFASKMGNQLYENGIFNWYMPDEFDPAHPPFLGFVLAIFWKLFGHTLWVSHLAMIPFITGFIYQLSNLIEQTTGNKKLAFLGCLMVIADPTIATANVLVNPEIIILFFFLLAVNGILKNNQKLLFIGLLFMSIISYRSLMIFAGLILFDVLNDLLLKKEKLKTILNFKRILFYVVTALPGISYLIWRLLTKGWIYTHPNSPWSEYSHRVDVFGFIKNIAVLFHRYLDFGRVFIFIFLIIAFVNLRNKIVFNQKQKQLFLLSISSVSLIIIAVLFSTNAFGHRYFLPSYICFIILAFSILTTFKKHSKLIYSLLFIGLITGNLWVYPEKTSQAWDATLAHTPYHSLRKQAISYLDNHKIQLNTVGTFFPNYNTIDQIELNGDHRKMNQFTKSESYVFYSNVYNLSDSDYDFVKANYIEIKRFENFNIYVSILKKKN